jgi:outer membrane protein TolC
MSVHSALGPVGIALACCVFLWAASPAAAQTKAAITVEEASRLAQACSESIRIRELAVQKSRLAVNEATAKAGPHVEFDAYGSYLVNPPTGYEVEAGSIGAINIPALGVNIPLPEQDIMVGAELHNYYTVAATLSQPLYTWGKIRNAVDAAMLQVQSAGTDLLSQRRDIEREVHRTYFGALLASESEAVLRRIADCAALIVSDRQSALDQGTLTREAVLEAQARRQQVDARLSEAAQSKSTALENLSVLTGLDPSGIQLATGFPDAAPTLDEQALRDQARIASTDLAAFRNRREQALKKLSIEKGGSILHPDVSLGVSLGASGQEDLPYSGWQWNNTTWNLDLVITLGVKMSVFDSMESKARIGQAEKDAEMAAQGLLQAEKLTRVAVRKAVEAEEKAKAELMEKKAQERYTAERMKNTQVSTGNGIANREDLYGAEILLGNAQLDRLLAQFTLEESLADIARLTGQVP